MPTKTDSSRDVVIDAAGPMSTPALVLLPGLDGTGELFAPLLRELGAELPCIVVRYPNEPLDYAAHEALVRAALPSDRDYILLGESFSGPIAVSFAAAAAPGLIGLVLSASFVRCPSLVLSWLRPFIPLFSPRNVPAAVADHVLLGRFATPELRRLRAETARQASRRAVAARLAAIVNVDVSRQMARVQVPSLYLQATEDRLVPAAAAEAVAQLSPRTAFVTIEGPHLLLQASAAQAARIIRDFAGSVVADGGERR